MYGRYACFPTSCSESHVSAAGAKVSPHVKVEIHPAYAFDQQELVERIAPGTTITEDTYLA